MKKFLLTMALMSLSSCTSYGDMGYTGGVSSYLLNDNTYKVFAKGNAFDSKEKIQMFVMLKSAELAKEKGFGSFNFLDSNSEYNTSFYTNSTPETFSGSYYGNSYDKIDNQIFTEAHTVSHSQIYQYNKPTSSAIVIMDKDNNGIFKTDEIIKNLSYLKDTTIKKISNNISSIRVGKSAKNSEERN
jgi:hypothetical protein